ncbi:MAG: BrnT family toxin [Thermomicrobiales bacterium]
MEFEWDPAKAELNREKHGIDFIRAEDVFFDSHCILQDSTRERDPERRSKAIGKIDDGRLFTVIFTIRGDRTRIISARRAWDNERRKCYTSSEAT